MIIAGAGLAGLIAGHVFRAYRPVLIEKNEYLPHMHQALLRFPSESVGRATGIPFKQVWVQKGIWSKGFEAPNIGLANKYSMKVTGKVMPRSIWSADTHGWRWIAPDDFVERLANPLAHDIHYGKPFDFKSREGHEPVISTLPMPVLMGLLGWKDIPKFEHRPIYVRRCQIDKPDINVHQTIYFPGIEPYYRVSIVGKQVIIEYAQEPENVDEIGQALYAFGLSDVEIIYDNRVHMQPFGKIVPINDALRKEFINWATVEHNVYSLGRFATWRNILLDDVVKDCEVIQRLLAAGDRYTLHLAQRA